MAITAISQRVVGSAEDRHIFYRIIRDSGPDLERRVRTKNPSFDVIGYKAVLQSRLESDLANDEVDQWIEETGAQPLPVEAAKPRYLSRWRSQFKGTMRQEAVRMGYHMKTSFDRGDFTRAQMRNAWSMTNAELTDFLERLEAKRLKYIGIDSEVGE